MGKRFMALMTIFLFQTSADAADKIRIAFGTGISSILFPLAQKKGFLKDEGIDAEVIQLGGNLAIAALTNGDLDYNTALNPSVGGAIQGELSK
jgi:ABC-type nitrate/sulfonate/bicarbonate transport system substrate-binding protein